MYTKRQQLQRIVREYEKAGQKWPATTAEMAQWAVNTGRYDLTAPTLERHRSQRTCAGYAGRVLHGFAW